MFKIETMQGHERMSTQDLLLAIGDAVKQGETEFEIAASGQHDIGGPLWHPEGKTLHFHVTNAGQRLGSMCLPGTEIVADGSVSADVGWLNSGGTITVKGDAGDTAGHCSSGGKIFIGGRGGTRTGSLMKTRSMRSRSSGFSRMLGHSRSSSWAAAGPSSVAMTASSLPRFLASVPVSVW